jgi:hypothetical protein
MLMTMPQSRHQELKKASDTDVDQNSTQSYGKATFNREYPTSVRTGGTSRPFCNSPVQFTSQFWWGDVRQHWQPLLLR